MENKKCHWAHRRESRNAAGGPGTCSQGPGNKGGITNEGLRMRADLLGQFATVGVQPPADLGGEVWQTPPKHCPVPWRSGKNTVPNANANNGNWVSDLFDVKPSITL